MKALTGQQRSRSRQLRREQTDAEKHLYRYLRSRQVAGAKFRRQFPIGAYVADFCCLEVGLIVELDGGQHVERESHDAKRTMALEEKGFRVLRFWNDDVLQNTEAVLEQISNAVDLGRMKPRLRGHKAVEE